MGAGPVVIILGVVVVIALIWYFDPLGNSGSDSGSGYVYTGAGPGGANKGEGGPRQ